MSNKNEIKKELNYNPYLYTGKAESNIGRSVKQTKPQPKTLKKEEVKENE